MKKFVGIVAINQHNHLVVLDVPNQLQSLGCRKISKNREKFEVLHKDLVRLLHLD
jgi:hypothetical protein